MNTSITAAPNAKPIPMPSDVTLRFSSSWASSSSSRTIALVCAATCLTATPRPCESASWVGMASPVDEPREGDSSHQRSADDQERDRAAALLPALLTLTELRTGRGQRSLSRLLVRRRLSFRARLDQARLQLADEVGILGERLGELGLDAALARQAV